VVAGLRSPSEYEQRKISAYIQAEFSQKIRFRKGFSVAFLVLGLILLCGIQESRFAGALLGIGCLAAAVCTLLGIPRLRRIIHTFAEGDFQVLDCVVLDIQPNPNEPGASNVQCGVPGSKPIPGLFRARKEELKTGMQILYITAEIRGDKKPMERVFTPFMLTEEGIQKHL
jgi:hypothetical protein